MSADVLPVGTVVAMDDAWLGLVVAVQDFRATPGAGEIEGPVYHDVVTKNLAPHPYLRSELTVATAEQVAAAHPSQLRVYSESYGVEPLIPAVSS